MKLFKVLLLLNVLWILGCQAGSKVDYYVDADYKADSKEDTSVLLFQYKFVNPVDEHELWIIDNEKQQYRIRVKESQSNEGFVVNLPVDKEYAIASFILFDGTKKRELQLGKTLPLFKLTRDRVTRIRGFDIINDKDPTVNTISIAPWDGMTDNLLIVQAARKFQVPERMIRTINIFRN